MSGSGIELQMVDSMTRSGIELQMDDFEIYEDHFACDAHENALVLPNPKSLIRSLRLVLRRNKDRHLLPIIRETAGTPLATDDANFLRIHSETLSRAQTPNLRDEDTPTLSWAESTSARSTSAQSIADNERDEQELTEIARATDKDIMTLIVRAASVSPVESSGLPFINPVAQLFVMLGHLLARIETDGYTYLTSAEFLKDFKTIKTVLAQEPGLIDYVTKDVEYVMSRLAHFDPEFHKDYLAKVEKETELTRIEQARADAAALLLQQQNATLCWHPFRTAAAETSAAPDATDTNTRPSFGGCVIA